VAALQPAAADALRANWDAQRAALLRGGEGGVGRAPV
jgi:hypothetical protein